MPKNFQGMNSKSAEAKARKAQLAEVEKAKKQRDAEDTKWEDNDKHAARKQQRKAAQEKKRQEGVLRKKELEDLYKADEEAAVTKSKAAAAKSTPKVTRAQLEEMRRKQEEERAEQAKKEELAKKKLVPVEETIEENMNQVIADRILQGEVEARSVEEAIAALAVQGDVDRHPERRMKASYKKFEDCYMPMKKAEFPSMRQSQLRQMLKKEWKSSTENPMNQNHGTYNKH